MKTTNKFLAVAKATPVFPEVEKLPLSSKIKDWHITVSGDGIMRFYRYFDFTENEIKKSLKMQSASVEDEIANTKNEIYKDELKSLNRQLSQMVQNSSKTSSLEEWWIKLRDANDIVKIVNEILLADKRTIGGIIYLLGGPLTITDKETEEVKTIQKNRKDYDWIRVYTKEMKDKVKGVVKLSNGDKVSVKEYLDNYDISSEDWVFENGIEEEEMDSIQVREYFSRLAGLD